MDTALSDLTTEQVAALQALHFFENATPPITPVPDFLLAAAVGWPLPRARAVLVTLARLDLAVECKATMHERRSPALETGDFPLPGGRVATVSRETADDGGPVYSLAVDGAVTYPDVVLNRHAITIPGRKLAEAAEVPRSRPYGVNEQGRLTSGLAVEIAGAGQFVDFITPFGFGFETLGYGLTPAGYLLAVRAGRAVATV